MSQLLNWWSQSRGGLSWCCLEPPSQRPVATNWNELMFYSTSATNLEVADCQCLCMLWDQVVFCCVLLLLSNSCCGCCNSCCCCCCTNIRVMLGRVDCPVRGRRLATEAACIHRQTALLFWHSVFSQLRVVCTICPHLSPPAASTPATSTSEAPTAPPRTKKAPPRRPPPPSKAARAPTGTHLMHWILCTISVKFNLRESRWCSFVSLSCNDITCVVHVLLCFYCAPSRPLVGLTYLPLWLG